MSTDLESLFKQNEYETNEKVSRAARILLYFELLIGILCWIHIFNISNAIINWAIAATLLPLLLPTIVVDTMHIGKPWVKYMNVVCMIAVTGIYYVIFTFQTILLLVIPTILAALYFGKRVFYFSCVGTVINIIISHFITVYFLFQPWIEPFTGLKPIMIYGALPRVIQYMCCSFIIGILSSRYSKFINGFYLVSRDNERLNKSREGEGDKVISRELTETLNSMTEREKEVCLLISQGYTNAQIANQLCLSVGTVKNYVSVIYDKVGIKDRTALALKLVRSFKEND